MLEKTTTRQAKCIELGLFILYDFTSGSTRSSSAAATSVPKPGLKHCAHGTLTWRARASFAREESLSPLESGLAIVLSKLLRGLIHDGVALEPLLEHVFALRRTRPDLDREELHGLVRVFEEPSEVEEGIFEAESGSLQLSHAVKELIDARP